MKKLYSILILAVAAICLFSCSKDDGREEKENTDLPPYSIKIKKDGKAIYQGDICGGALTYNHFKEGFMIVNMVVFPKYPDNPDSKTVETCWSFDNGSLLSLSQFFSLDIISKEGTFKAEPQLSDTGYVLGKLYYYGSTDGENWTPIDGEHVITKVKVKTEKLTGYDGTEAEMKKVLIDGNFTIKYKDKTGAHTITGEYRNLFDCVYREN